MSNQINETRSFVQGKLAEFCKKVSQGQTRPVQKFFHDILMGICGTGSPSLHNIAKMLMDNVSTMKTSERLYRNMRREGLAEEIDRTFMGLIKPQVTKETLFIVDESDIEKPYAKKMEGCQLVHNGSKGENSNGYLLLNIMAMLPKGFIYYRITDALNTCIKMIVQYKRTHSIEVRRDQWQLKIRLD